MKTELGKLRDSFGTLLSNELSDDIKIDTLIVSNVSAQDVSVDAVFVRQSETFCLLNACLIPRGKSLLLDPAKDSFLNLQPGDSIRFKCSLDMGADFVLSHSVDVQAVGFA